jgi:hypothetical protein
MALTADVHIERYGVAGDNHQPYNLPIGANVTVYRGSIALTDTTGNLKNAASPLSTDTCWGLIDTYGPGTVDTVPGLNNASTVAGVVSADIATGTFFLASATGADQLSQSTYGKTVYVVNETTVGLTSNGGTRPVAGCHVYTEAAGRVQAPGPYAIKLGSTSPGGGP